MPTADEPLDRVNRMLWIGDGLPRSMTATTDFVVPKSMPMIFSLEAAIVGQFCSWFHLNTIEKLVLLGI